MPHKEAKPKGGGIMAKNKEDISTLHKLMISAAKDINRKLECDPPLDAKADEEALLKDLLEVIPSLDKEKDDLAVATWNTLDRIAKKEDTEEEKQVEKPVDKKEIKEEAKVEEKKEIEKPVKEKKSKATRVTPLSAFTGKLQAKYKGKKLTATVKNGVITFKGKSHKSPSMAGAAALESAGRTGKVTCNGWTFWSYEQKPDEWVMLDIMRK